MADINTPYKEIPLTRGRVALVDAEDFDDVSRFKWYAHRGNKGNWYACRSFRRKGTQHIVYMHRYLLGDPNSIIDHKNRNGLDNQRGNLRMSSRELNAINTGANSTKRGTTFRGVQYCHSRPNLARRWIVRFESEGRRFFLGYYATAEEAARVYDAKAKELFGEFAYLNFPNQGATT